MALVLFPNAIILLYIPKNTYLPGKSRKLAEKLFLKKKKK